MIKNFFKNSRNKKILILFSIIILGALTIKLTVFNDNNDSHTTSFVISQDDDDGSLDEDSDENTATNLIDIKEEDLLGQWEFETDEKNKAYSKPSNLKLDFKKDSFVTTDVHLFHHDHFIDNSNEEKYSIEKGKETSIKILYNISPEKLEEIRDKYGDYAFKFNVKDFTENKITVDLSYISKDSKKEKLHGYLIKCTNIK